MTSTDTLLPCEHCGCRFGYHEAGCAALVDDIVSVAVTGFKTDVQRILSDKASTPPTPATDEREAVARARALGQAAEHINRLEAALRGLLITVERLDISEGVCCCGDDMATHAEPMSCGHTPVDAGHYHHGNAIQQARDAIEHGSGK